MTLVDIHQLNTSNHAFLSFHTHAQEPHGVFSLALKDNILMQGEVSSAGSAMLAGYIAPYTATCAQRLIDADIYIVGTTTMDEFAMGTAGENTPHPIAINPHGINRIAGGSSSGSAVAVASGMVQGALGTDTGGSIRLPASFCGIVGLKPTYGAVSRYGVIAMASSLDQVGTFATSIDDTQMLFETIQGYDPHDATSVDHQRDKTTIKPDALRIGLPKQFFDTPGLDYRIREKVMRIVEHLEAAGAEIQILDIPLLDAGVAVYYTLCPAEVSSNMARLDGMRFGLQHDTMDSESYQAYISTIRAEGFGDEVIRRILLGAHILSAAEYEGLYLKAMDLRVALAQQMIDIYKHVDVIISPTSPTLPRNIGAQMDPVSLYLADIYTVTANIVGCPAISVPIGTIDEKNTTGEIEKLPVGLQIMGAHRSEYRLFGVGRQIEEIMQGVV